MLLFRPKVNFCLILGSQLPPDCLPIVTRLPHDPATMIAVVS